MNIVFFGSAEFSMGSLRALITSRHKVVALVTQPDRKKGRSLKLSPPPTKVLAASHGIPVYQPEDASIKESVKYLKDLKPDLFVVVSFGQILKKELLAVPRLYSINLHASLLPKYRGAAPVNWAVINGDKETGATIMRMDEGMDSGGIMAQEEIPIGEDDTSLTMSEKISERGAGLLVAAIESIEKDKTKFVKQDASRATYAPKMKKEDGLIDWKEDAFKIHNLTKGLLPWPGAYTRHKGKILKVLMTGVSPLPGAEGGSQPGEVMEATGEKGIIVATGHGALAITYLQLEGKKILDAASFLRGHRMEKGEILG